MKKYIHEIRLDLKETTDLDKLCDDLCKREDVYLNPKKISKNQLKELLTKLWESNFKKGGPDKENLNQDFNAPDAAAPVDGGGGERKKNFFERKRFIDNPM